MLIMHEWRNLKLLKRAGRGMVDDGVASTEDGGLAVPCRMCPVDGVNLPLGWRNASKEDA